MMMKWLRGILSRVVRGDNEYGQSAILFALGMMAILASTALVVDLGRGYVERRFTQNASDAAAEAGTITIINNSHATARIGKDYLVKAAIDQYAAANNTSIDYTSTPPRYFDANQNLLSAVGSGANIPETAVGVKVTVSKSVETAFAPLFGRDTVDVGSVSTCRSNCAEMPDEATGMIPVSVPKQDFLKTSTYTLWDSQYWSSYGYTTEANFKGVLDLNDLEGGGSVVGEACGATPQCVADWTRYGYDGTIHVGNSIGTITGEYGNQVKGALTDMLNSSGKTDAGGKYIIVQLPVWDNYFAEGSKNRVTIWGFASFKIYAAEITSNGITGRFVSFVSPGSNPITGSTTCVAWGPQIPRFVSGP